MPCPCWDWHDRACTGTPHIVLKPSIQLQRIGLPIGLLIAPTLLCVLTGCASPQQQIMLTSQRQNQAYEPQFVSAYTTEDGGGDTDVVLLDRAAEQLLAGHAAESPVQQIMHIRVLWTPNRDLKPDHTSASNATVHWYVLSTNPQAADVLEYAGTAFVAVEPTGNGTELKIRNASLRPVACRGTLCDPVGASTLHGTVRATANRARVRAALSGVRTLIAAASALPDSATFHSHPEAPSSLAR